MTLEMAAIRPHAAPTCPRFSWSPWDQRAHSLIVRRLPATFTLQTPANCLHADELPKTTPPYNPGRKFKTLSFPSPSSEHVLGRVHSLSGPRTHRRLPPTQLIGATHALQIVETRRYHGN